MKILLLGFTKMKIMPYANFYLDQINCITNEVHMVYWNRDLKDEDLSRYKNVHFHEFRRFMEDSIPKRDKIGSFIAYRKFVLPILKEYNFDFIFSLHTMPGLVLLDKLSTKYNHRYVFDYRDHTFEENYIFGKMIKKLASHAKLVFVSSDAYRKYLPNNKNVEIISSHNLLIDSLNHRDDRKTKYVKSDRIRLSFWGLLRQVEHNKLIINKISKDSRFELHYYGRGQKAGIILQAYKDSINAENVYFHGEYTPEERYDFINHTDIIHNNYCDANSMLAMGNKYYDGVIFRIPQLCMEGSFMGKRSVKAGVGIMLDPKDPKFTDKLYNYYKSIDFDSFNRNCDLDLNSILKEYEYGSHRINQILGQQ